MEIIRILKIRRYALIAIVATIAMGIAYPVLQTPSNLANLDVWFAAAPRENLIFYPIYSILFGSLVALQIYRIKGPKVCSIKKGSAASTFGTAMTFLIGQCPACVGLAGLFLPAGAALFIATNTLLFNVIAMGLLLLGIMILGGFRKSATFKPLSEQGV